VFDKKLVLYIRTTLFCIHVSFIRGVMNKHENVISKRKVVACIGYYVVVTSLRKHAVSPTSRRRLCAHFPGKRRFDPTVAKGQRHEHIIMIMTYRLTAGVYGAQVYINRTWSLVIKL